MKESNPSPLLVFGDDGGEASDRGWRWIASHRWPGWTIDVMTADADPSHIRWGEPVRHDPWTPPWDRDPAAIDADEVRFLTAAADPRAMLAEVNADLMVLGRKPVGYLGSVLTGSTTEWLLHHPPSPLAIIRTGRPVTRVLVCADGSIHAERAVETFASLPLARQSVVTVLSVDDGRADRGAAEKAAAALEPHVASVTELVRSGRPTDEILTLVGEGTPDLVVLGTRGLTGWRRLRLGSTASAVVRSAPCDALVASVESGDEPS